MFTFPVSNTVFYMERKRIKEGKQPFHVDWQREGKESASCSSSVECSRASKASEQHRGCPEGLPTALDSREEDDRGHDNLRKRNILCVVPKLQIHILERK